MHDTSVDQIRLHSRFGEFRELIEKIANGADLWNDAEHLQERKRVLLTFAAQPSTTHHVERGVKLGALAKKTGKQELKVSLHVMASNPFREFTKRDLKSNEDEDDGDEDEDEEEEPSTKTKRLSARESSVEIEKRIAELGLKKLSVLQRDQEAYEQKKKDIANAISIKNNSYLVERSMWKKLSLIEKKQPKELEFALEQIEGWDVPPRLEGKIVFSDLRKDKHLQDLIKELQHREDMPSDPAPTFTTYKKQLIANEKKLLREKYPTATESEINIMAKLFAPQCHEALFSID